MTWDSRGIYKELCRKSGVVASLLSTNPTGTLWDLWFRLVQSKEKEPGRRSGQGPGTCWEHSGLPQGLARVLQTGRVMLPSLLDITAPGCGLTDVVPLPGSSV